MRKINENTIKEALRLIAEKENLTEEEVQEGIILAISLAIKSNASKTREFLQNIPCKGNSPTVDEVADYIIVKLADEK